MVDHCDFVEQASNRDGDGKLLRPDLIVKLPGRKNVVIDSKVPLEAYLDAMRTDIDDDERRRHLVRHARLVRAAHRSARRQEVLAPVRADARVRRDVHAGRVVLPLRARGRPVADRGRRGCRRHLRFTDDPDRRCCARSPTRGSRRRSPRAHAPSPASAASSTSGWAPSRSTSRRSAATSTPPWARTTRPSARSRRACSSRRESWSSTAPRSASCPKSRRSSASRDRWSPRSSATSRRCASCRLPTRLNSARAPRSRRLTRARAGPG